MEFIETPEFSRELQKVLSDAEYRALQIFLVRRPDAGAIIPGSRGLRKLRWGLRGIGKRGGARIIYFWKNAAGQIVMLHMYRKSETENVPLSKLLLLRSQIRDD